MNGDGYADIIAGIGDGGGPEVRIISGKDLANGSGIHAIADFFAADPNERNGARVGISKLDGDNKADLLVGTTGARLSTFSGASISGNINPAQSLSFNVFTGVVGGVYVG